MTPSAPVLLDHPPCVQCGYDLRATAPDSRCPECGAAVADTLRHQKLLRIDPFWFDDILKGLKLVIYAMVAVLAIWLTIPFGLLFFPLVVGLLLAGAWSMMAPQWNPWAPGRRDGRQILRVSSVVLLLLALLVFIDLLASRGRSVASDLVGAWMALAPVCTAAALCLMLVWCRRLAVRLGIPALRSLAVPLMLGVVLLTGSLCAAIAFYFFREPHSMPFRFKTPLSQLLYFANLAVPVAAVLMLILLGWFYRALESRQPPRPRLRGLEDEV